MELVSRDPASHGADAVTEGGKECSWIWVHEAEHATRKKLRDSPDSCRDHRQAAGRRLDDGDAESLSNRGVEKNVPTGEHCGHVAMRHLAEEFDTRIESIRLHDLVEEVALGAIAANDEVHVRDGRTRLRKKLRKEVDSLSLH